MRLDAVIGWDSVTVPSLVKVLAAAGSKVSGWSTVTVPWFRTLVRRYRSPPLPGSTSIGPVLVISPGPVNNAYVPAHPRRGEPDRPGVGERTGGGDQGVVGAAEPLDGERGTRGHVAGQPHVLVGDELARPGARDRKARSEFRITTGFPVVSPFPWSKSTRSSRELPGAGGIDGTRQVPHGGAVATIGWVSVTVPSLVKRDPALVVGQGLIDLDRALVAHVRPEVAVAAVAHRRVDGPGVRDQPGR